MAKFHINSKGVPAPCKAQKGNCPFGGADSHYNTIEEAQEAINKFNEEKYGIMKRINPITQSYNIPKNIAKETKLNKKLFLEQNHSLKKAEHTWVHLNENDEVVGIMDDPVILIKNNGELLEVIDNSLETNKNSITKLKTINLLSNFGLMSDNNLSPFTPKEDLDEYRNINETSKRKQDKNNFEAFKMMIAIKGGNKTDDLFANETTEISDYFEKNKGVTPAPSVVNYNPDTDDWETQVPHIDNFSTKTWKSHNMDIHKMDNKWAVVDQEGNLYARMNNPGIVINFDTETIESIGEYERLEKECENAKKDTRFTKDNNKMLNQIGLVKMDDKNNNLSHIRNLLNYSWAFKK